MSIFYEGYEEQNLKASQKEIFSEDEQSGFIENFVGSGASQLAGFNMFSESLNESTFHEQNDTVFNELFKDGNQDHKTATRFYNTWKGMSFDEHERIKNISETRNMDTELSLLNERNLDKGTRAIIESRLAKVNSYEFMKDILEKNPTLMNRDIIKGKATELEKGIQSRFQSVRDRSNTAGDISAFLGGAAFSTLDPVNALATIIPLARVAKSASLLTQIGVKGGSAAAANMGAETILQLSSIQPYRKDYLGENYSYTDVAGNVLMAGAGGFFLAGGATGLGGIYKNNFGHKLGELNPERLKKMTPEKRNIQVAKALSLELNTNIRNFSKTNLDEMSMAQLISQKHTRLLGKESEFNSKDPAINKEMISSIEVELKEIVKGKMKSLNDELENVRNSNTKKLKSTSKSDIVTDLKGLEAKLKTDAGVVIAKGGLPSINKKINDAKSQLAKFDTKKVAEGIKKENPKMTFKQSMSAAKKQLAKNKKEIQDIEGYVKELEDKITLDSISKSARRDLNRIGELRNQGKTDFEILKDFKDLPSTIKMESKKLDLDKNVTTLDDVLKGFDEAVESGNIVPDADMLDARRFLSDYISVQKNNPLKDIKTVDEFVDLHMNAYNKATVDFIKGKDVNVDPVLDQVRVKVLEDFVKKGESGKIDLLEELRIGQYVKANLGWIKSKLEGAKSFNSVIKELNEKFYRENAETFGKENLERSLAKQIEEPKNIPNEKLEQHNWNLPIFDKVNTKIKTVNKKLESIDKNGQKIREEANDLFESGKRDEASKKLDELENIKKEKQNLNKEKDDLFDERFKVARNNKTKTKMDTEIESKTLKNTEQDLSNDIDSDILENLRTKTKDAESLLNTDEGVNLTYKEVLEEGEVVLKQQTAKEFMEENNVDADELNSVLNCILGK